MAEQIYPKGLRVWPPREGAPAFVKGRISIHAETFIEWMKTNTDEKGYISLDLKDGRDGIYASVNTWKRQTTEKEDREYDKKFDQQLAEDSGPNPDDIPF